MDHTFAGEIIEWRGPAPYYFVTVPPETGAALRAAAAESGSSWGAVPVRASLDGAEWTTSLWSRDGAYLLPLKDAVRKPAGLGAGDTVDLHVSFEPRKQRQPRPQQPRKPAVRAVGSREPVLSEQLTIVPANQAKWVDLQAIFGETGDPARCWCQRFRMLPKESWASEGPDELAARLRDQTACTNPNTTTTTGLIAYLNEPGGLTSGGADLAGAGSRGADPAGVGVAGADLAGVAVGAVSSGGRGSGGTGSRGVGLAGVDVGVGSRGDDSGGAGSGGAGLGGLGSGGAGLGGGDLGLGVAVGWCAVGPRAGYARLVRDFRVPWVGRDEDKADGSVWAVTCFVTRLGYRRRGISRLLAAAAVGFARDRGARAIEGYPDLVDGGFVGSFAAFADAGFAEVSRPGNRRAVMRIDF
ncbi:DUF1905 domain-containing protein [Kribbella sp. GL6]|uniref:DUF1905 domain-containing protein n=1 Tax=Kribbella sp. GL6 TaxID=3419765 RepID=UPI003CFD51C2